MTLENKNLIRKLAFVLALKLAVLTALWWGFVREQRVTVDAETIAAKLLASPPTQTKE